MSTQRGVVHRPVARPAARPVEWLITRLIRGYQTTLSPGLGPACRYLPSCSDYALQAIEGYGVVRGGAMTVWRLLRCNPLSAGAYDPPYDPPHTAPCDETGAGARLPRAARWRVFHVKHRPGTSR